MIDQVYRKLSNNQQQSIKCIAIVHENLEDELHNFQKFMPNTEIYINSDKSMYRCFTADGTYRRLSISTLLFNPRAWSHGIKSFKAVKGNVKGKQGMILGGMFVLSSPPAAEVVYHYCMYNVVVYCI